MQDRLRNRVAPQPIPTFEPGEVLDFDPEVADIRDDWDSSTQTTSYRRQ